MNDELEDYDKRISSLTEKLIRKEENYYRQFTTLERYLNMMNAQSAWLAMQFNQG
jgi:flagellar hook-associated protein 2